ncbi:LAMI_0E02652g1_1 [Lachancea mirantina]|uniref:LAMI_0E02652g1_1 n=1 Tax=Lachancea mirantina TaxID=1230905 RepID=A0A1G4JK00_9SACH|nr:LAMI_0E02652g1_1 [Lachancea mirantina]
MFAVAWPYKYFTVFCLGGLVGSNFVCGQVLPRHEDNIYESRPPYGDDFDNEFDVDLILFSVLFMVSCYFLLTIIYFCIKYLVRRYLTTGISLNGQGTTRILGPAVNARWPSALDDENVVRDKLAKMSPEEQFYYKQGEEFIRQNPPLVIPEAIGTDAEDPIINEQTLQFIEEEGAHAWEFQPNANLPNDTILVENRTEITFLNYNYDASVMANLPIPRINRIYYCEFKIFELNTAGSGNNQLSDSELISFGLCTSPYPYFRLPGRHHHSIAYDSSGGRRFNDSFEQAPELASLFPRCEKGDVIGIGYRSNSGTVFFTRNGKKLKEKSVGGHIKGWKLKYLYPIVGANLPCKVHVNFGTHGFVYIEANVKKWGYAKLNGIKLPPPSYEDYDQDVLVESNYEDDLSDNESVSTSEVGNVVDREGHLLPPPPGFEFSTSPSSVVGDEYTLNSLPAEPPSYISDDHESIEIQNSAPGAGDSREDGKSSHDDNDEAKKNAFVNQFL